MSSSWQTEDDSDSDNEVYDGPNAMGGRDAIVFMVDAFLSDNQERFQDCLNLIRDALLSGILTRDRDLIGIVFCNTSKSPEPKDKIGMENIVVSQNTAVFLPLKQLSKEIVDYYLNFSTENYFDFKNNWGTEAGSFANALRLCTFMFKQCGWKLRTSTIIYFTDRDTPHPTDKSEYQRAFQKAKDLAETDIEFNLIPMYNDFQYDKFYQEFICMVKDIDLDEFIVPNLEQERKMVINRNLKNSFKKCSVHLKWKIVDTVIISVALYKYCKKSIYPKSVKLLRDNNTVIDVKRQTKAAKQDPETQDIIDEKYLNPGDERNILNFGGRILSLTTEQMTKFKYSMQPGLRLIGFKSKSTLSIHNFYKSSAFLYPNDKHISGSTQLFRALWEKCLEKEKIAICYMVTRRKTAGHYVALEPTKIKDFTNENSKIMKQNDGFRVLIIPDETYIRQINLSNYSNRCDEVPEAGIELFKKVAKKLTINFTPDVIKDSFMEILQPNMLGTAFDIAMQGTGDGGMPNIETQDDRIEKYISNLTEIFGEDLEIAEKRTAADAGSDEENPPKVQKITEECPSRQTVQRLIETEQLTALTVKQLRNYLQTHDFKGLTTATKPVLIEKILELHQ